MGALCSSLASIERSLESTKRFLESIERFLDSIERLLPPTKRPSYDDLPAELLDLVIARLPDPADRARARAVCRSWHAAVRRRGAQPWRLPSTMCPIERLRSLPRGAKTVGSTDDWLAVRVGEKPGRYLMHNPFVKKTVPLAELEAVIGNHKSYINKFLMRSGADDLIAVITNNRMHAFMVIRPGKGVWLPPPRTRPYVDIIDVALLQWKLYALTDAEDLIPFDLALDIDGSPIKQSQHYYGSHHGHGEEQLAAAPNDISTHNSSAHVWSPTGTSDNVYITSRHLIESSGKLLMVRHHHQVRPKTEYRPGAIYITRRVEVFEADTATGAWIPVTGGLGGGRALFISTNFSKSVAAPCGEVEEDSIYFMGTGEVFNLKTRTCSPSRLCSSFWRLTWLFHPELVF